jgi:hypothetical protein
MADPVNQLSEFVGIFESDAGRARSRERHSQKSQATRWSAQKGSARMNEPPKESAVRRFRGEPEQQQQPQTTRGKLPVSDRCVGAVWTPKRSSPAKSWRRDLLPMKIPARFVPGANTKGYDSTRSTSVICVGAYGDAPKQRSCTDIRRYLGLPQKPVVR